MREVELLETALHVAKRLGFHVRFEPLSSLTGGRCEYSGKRWIFLDAAASTSEQLAIVLGILADEPGSQVTPMPEALWNRIQMHASVSRRSA